MKCLICGKELGEADRHRDDTIEQSWGKLPGAFYSCNCAAISCVRPLPPRARDEQLHQNGWMASRSPCEGDVDAR